MTSVFHKITKKSGKTQQCHGENSETSSRNSFEKDQSINLMGYTERKRKEMAMDLFGKLTQRA